MQRHSKILGFKEAYQFLDISYTHLYRLIERYNIPFQKIGRGRIFFEEDLKAVQTARKENNEPPKYPSPKNRPKLLGYGEARKLVGVSHPRFLVLLKRYDIPHVRLFCGRVFYESDLKEFMHSEKRVEMMKHGKKD